MRKRTWLVQLAPFALLIWAASAQAANNKVLNVQVQRGEVRATASPLGSIVGTAAYGDQMQVLEEKGAWIKVVKAGGLTGWMHTSALTKQTIKLQAGAANADTAASSGEQALAGKGFSKEVESAYRDKNKTVDFAWVDKMGKFKVSQPDALSFLKDGKLKLAEGGAQ